MVRGKIYILEFSLSKVFWSVRRLLLPLLLNTQGAKKALLDPFGQSGLGNKFLSMRVYISTPVNALEESLT